MKVNGASYTLPFETNVRVAASGNGRQLCFVGGDQQLDLQSIALAADPDKDHVAIGPVKQIDYFTSKAFHNFEPTQYFHRFGEEGGSLPILCFDTLNQALYLVGGDYRVKPEGIVN